MTFGQTLFAVTTGIIGSMFVAIAVGVRFNATESMPLGLYLQTTPIGYRGELVVACLDTTNKAVALGLQRGYFPVGNCPGNVAPVLKAVAAVAGDRIELAGDGLSINGRIIPSTVPLQFDPRGFYLPRTYPRAYTVQPGQVLLLAPGTGSFDGRYFGPTRIAGLRAAARPLLVASNP